MVGDSSAWATEFLAEDVLICNPSYMHAATSITQASILFLQWPVTQSYPVGNWIWPTSYQLGSTTAPQAGNRHLGQEGVTGGGCNNQALSNECSPLATACCSQGIFLVPAPGGRAYIPRGVAIYTWYMPGIYPWVWVEHIPAIYTEVCP